MATSLDSASALEHTVARYNDAWNAHDLDTIMSMHAPDMVFHNHTAGESAQGQEVRGHMAAIFDSWPDISFSRAAHVLPRGAGRAGVDGDRHPRQGGSPWRPGDRAHRAHDHLGRHGRDPVRGWTGQAQGRVLRFGVGAAPAGACSSDRSERAQAACPQSVRRHLAGLRPLGEPAQLRRVHPLAPAPDRQTGSRGDLAAGACGRRGHRYRRGRNGNRANATAPV